MSSAGTVPTEIERALATVCQAVASGVPLTEAQKEPVMLALARSNDQLGRSLLKAAIEEMERATARAVAGRFDPMRVVAESARADAERRRARIEHWKNITGLERASYLIAEASGGLGTPIAGRDLVRIAKLAVDPGTADTEPPSCFEPGPRVP